MSWDRRPRPLLSGPDFSTKVRHAEIHQTSRNRRSSHLLRRLENAVEDLGGRAQEFARKEPAQAVGIAFLAGLVLTLLPVGRIVSVLIRLAFALVRPALLILGAVKLCEEFDKRNNP